MRVRAVPAVDPIEPRWIACYDVSGALQGSIVTAFDDHDARLLARLISGSDENPPDQDVADAILEASRQAAGAVSQLALVEGARITADSGTAVPAGPPIVFELTSNQDFTMQVACWAEIARSPARAVARTAAPVPKSDPTAAPNNLDVVLDIELPLSVRFGERDMTLQALTRLGLGSIIDLGRSPDDPVDVLINDRIVARGEVVVVAGNYGVRITEVISAAERIRSLTT